MIVIKHIDDGGVAPRLVAGVCRQVIVRNDERC